MANVKEKLKNVLICYEERRFDWPRDMTSRTL